MKLHGQYSNKLKRLNKNKAKHSRSHESTGVDNTDRQNIMTDLLRHNGWLFAYLGVTFSIKLMMSVVALLMSSLDFSSKVLALYCVTALRGFLLQVDYESN